MVEDGTTLRLNTALAAGFYTEICGDPCEGTWKVVAIEYCYSGSAPGGGEALVTGELVSACAIEERIAILITPGTQSSQELKVSLTVTEAWWGDEEGAPTKDSIAGDVVTDEVQAMVTVRRERGPALSGMAERLNLNPKADNSWFINTLGDPAPGVRKMLLIEYSWRSLVEREDGGSEMMVEERVATCRELAGVSILHEGNVPHEPPREAVLLERPSLRRPQEEPAEHPPWMDAQYRHDAEQLDDSSSQGHDTRLCEARIEAKCRHIAREMTTATNRPELFTKYSESHNVPGSGGGRRYSLGADGFEVGVQLLASSALTGEPGPYEVREQLLTRAHLLNWLIEQTRVQRRPVADDDVNAEPVGCFPPPPSSGQQANRGGRFAAFHWVRGFFLACSNAQQQAGTGEFPPEMLPIGQEVLTRMQPVRKAPGGFLHLDIELPTLLPALVPKAPVGTAGYLTDEQQQMLLQKNGRILHRHSDIVFSDHWCARAALHAPCTSSSPRPWLILPRARWYKQAPRTTLHVSPRDG